MSEPAKDRIEKDFYTYEDYKNFPDEIRCEIIDGQIDDMTPSPSIKHQDVPLCQNSCRVGGCSLAPAHGGPFAG